MNKRMKKLAEQAGLEELGDSDWCSLNHPDVRAEHLERFAELVRQDYLRELKAFREVLIGDNYILRFHPSDTGWMCGISNEMMDAIEEMTK